MADGKEHLRGIQIAMNTSDLVASLRLFSDFGFHNAGGRMIWGKSMAIQGLKPDARGTMWWLVGRQRFVQLELFNHSNPKQRPLPDDWRCSDLGWTRFGFSVPNLDAVRQTLDDWGIEIAGQGVDADGTKRLVFRDPFVGTFAEAFEEGAGVPGGAKPRYHDLDPAIVYATSSVSDLDEARKYYSDILGLQIVQDIVIHEPEHEQFFGLSGARSESFVVDTGSFLLEIVRYFDPSGRRKPGHHSIVDQGLMNIALAALDDQQFAEDAIERIGKAGIRMTPRSRFGGTYVIEPDREIEICGNPPDFESNFGFVPADPFSGG